jgi:D-alanine-D-alanine ligase
VRVVVLHDLLPPSAPPDAQDALVQVELAVRCLAGLGMTAEAMAADPDLDVLAAELARRAPDLVFNLVETYGGRADRIHWVPERLESLGIASTGAPSAALRQTTDKVAAKRTLEAAGLPTPAMLVAGTKAGDRARGSRWIVKPIYEDASVGIDDDACVSGSDADVLRIVRARSTAERPLFAEAFIDGRELNVSLLALPQGLHVLPAAEILFDAFPPEKPRIVGYAAKWAVESFEYRHTPRCFERLARDPALVGRLEAFAVRAFEAFDCAGYARVDFRVAADGVPCILEVNANPCLSEDAGFMAAAAQAGMTPSHVIEAIVASALARHRARPARVRDGTSAADALPGADAAPYVCSATPSASGRPAPAGG